MDNPSVSKTICPNGSNSMVVILKKLREEIIRKEAKQENIETTFNFISSLKKSEKMPPVISNNIPIKNRTISPQLKLLSFTIK